ncbi:MAG: hypothetical protein P1P76_00070 [Anaerolineales bacterium]|nr:hypothetical protein [Anaerolineales bacterium]
MTIQSITDARTCVNKNQAIGDQESVVIQVLCHPDATRQCEASAGAVVRDPAFSAVDPF